MSDINSYISAIPYNLHSLSDVQIFIMLLPLNLRMSLERHLQAICC
jgi:hypothetical protein